MKNRTKMEDVKTISKSDFQIMRAITERKHSISYSCNGVKIVSREEAAAHKPAGHDVLDLYAALSTFLPPPTRPATISS
jgi:hypothetical protein